MVYANTATLPLSEEVMELIDAHRQLVAQQDAIPAHEEETFSLAQPSPFRYVPSIASGWIPTEPAGE